jgi:hypothetical protein
MYHLTQQLRLSLPDEESDTQETIKQARFSVTEACER